MSRLIRMDQTGHTTLAEWTAAEPAAVENICEPALRLPAGHSLQPATEAQIFFNTHFAVERTAFGEVADPPAGRDRIPEDVLAVDGSPAGGGREKAG